MQGGALPRGVRARHLVPVGGLVRDHAADAAHHDLAGSALMEGTLLGVVRGLLTLEGAVLELVAVQGTWKHKKVDIKNLNQRSFEKIS